MLNKEISYEWKLQCLAEVERTEPDRKAWGNALLLIPDKDKAKALMEQMVAHHGKDAAYSLLKEKVRAKYPKETAMEAEARSTKKSGEEERKKSPTVAVNSGSGAAAMQAQLLQRPKPRQKGGEPSSGRMSTVLMKEMMRRLCWKENCWKEKRQAKQS